MFVIIFVSVVIAILCICLVILIRNEYEHIGYYLKHGKTELLGLPAPWTIRKSLKEHIETFQIPQKAGIFIDFGCGEGEVINEMYPLFSSSIGVELNKDAAELSKTRFATIPSVTIMEMDMTNFQFPQTEAFTLFMYEPLWKLTDEQAQSLYHTVISRAAMSNHEIFVIYVGAAKRSKLTEQFFSNLGFKTIVKTRAIRYVYRKVNEIFVFKSNPRKAHA